MSKHTQQTDPEQPHGCALTYRATRAAAGHHIAQSIRDENHRRSLAGEFLGPVYSLAYPEAVHQDMAIDPAYTRRNLAKTPAVQQAHNDCPGCDAAVRAFDATTQPRLWASPEDSA
jgi:hypothetical protein